MAVSRLNRYTADTFADAMKNLADACGENSLIKLGNKMFNLVHLLYVPGTLIGAHVSVFTAKYTSLKAALVGNKHMVFDTVMAGIFFLQSFCNDDSLSPLIQNLYDISDFTFEKLAS